MTSRSRFLITVSSILSASVLFTSCMSLIMGAGFSNMKSPDYIPLHKNVKIGDYAILKSFTKTEAVINPESTTKSRFEVIGKEGNLYVVRISFFEAAIPAMENYGFEDWVDKDGWVKKAFLLEGKGDATKKTVQTIAKKGETGFMEYTDLQTTAKMKNATRTFTNIKLYQANAYAGDAANNSKSVTFFAFQDDIPFQIVFGNTITDLNYTVRNRSQMGYMIVTTYTKKTTSMGTITSLIESGNTVSKTSTVYAEDYEFIK